MGGKFKNLVAKTSRIATATLLATSLGCNPMTENLRPRQPNAEIKLSDVNAMLEKLSTLGVAQEQKDKFVSLANDIEDSEIFMGYYGGNPLDPFKTLLNRPDFKPEYFKKFIEIIEILKKRTEHIPKHTPSFEGALHDLNSLLRTPNFKLWMLDYIKLFVEKVNMEPPLALPYAMSILNRITAHPDFEPEMLPQLVGILIKKKKYDIVAFCSIAENPSFTPKLLKEIDAAKEVAHKIMNTFEATLNFAFGFSVIGKDKTLELHKKNGITYFGRYTEEMLEETYASLDPAYKKEVPLLVAIFNKDDWNKAFYDDKNNLDKLRTYYRVMLFEIADADYFYKIIGETGQNYGKIDTLLIAGHGTPTSIEFYRAIYINPKLSYSNGQDLHTEDKKKLSKLKENFVENPTVILIACSTGKNEKSIGAVLSKIWGAEVWAPKEPSSLEEFILSDEGKIEGAVYHDNAAKKFKNGVSVDITEE